MASTSQTSQRRVRSVIMNSVSLAVIFVSGFCIGSFLGFRLGILLVEKGIIERALGDLWNKQPYIVRYVLLRLVWCAKLFREFEPKRVEKV